MAYISRDNAGEILALEEQISILRQCNKFNRQFVDILNKLSWELRNLDIIRSGALAVEALSISNQLHYEEGMANALLSRGVCRRNSAEYELALEDILQSREIFKQLNQQNGIGRSTMWVGLVHQRLGNYAAALTYFLDALQIFENLEDESNTAKCHTFIGRAYFDSKNYRNALDYFYRALCFRETTLDINAEATTYWDLGRTYLYLDNFDKALEYCERSLTMRIETRETRGLCASYYLRGEIYGKLGNAAIAIKNFGKSVRLSRELCDKWAEANGNCAIGFVYSELCATDSFKPIYFTQAEQYLFTALSIAEEIHAQGIIIDAHNFLAKHYQRFGQLDKTLFHLQQYQENRELLAERQSKQALQNLIFGYEIEKAQKTSEIYRLKNIELANANRELTRLNKEKNDFLTVVAHDLKNPLAGISIAISLMYEYRKSMTEEQQNDQFRIILRTVDSMKDLIVKLLDINALESGKVNIAHEPIIIEDLVRDIIEEYQSRTKAKNIHIIHFVNDNLSIMTDRRCLKEILDNLLSNAIKFSSQGQRIYIRAQAVNNNISISIRDEGPGISDKDLTKLFTKFSRLGSKPTSGESSTGLGLFIVKKLTELLGGHIRCDSVVGEGSTFTVSIPENPSLAEIFNFGMEPF